MGSFAFDSDAPAHTVAARAAGAHAEHNAAGADQKEAGGAAGELQEAAGDASAPDQPQRLFGHGQEHLVAHAARLHAHLRAAEDDCRQR